MLKIRGHLDNHLRLPDAPPQPFLEGLSMPSPTLNLIDAKELKEYFFEKKRKSFFEFGNLKNDGTGGFFGPFGSFSGKESYKNGVWKGGIYMREKSKW